LNADGIPSERGKIQNLDPLSRQEADFKQTQKKRFARSIRIESGDPTRLTDW
jgi:hypothetical protein